MAALISIAKIVGICTLIVLGIYLRDKLYKYVRGYDEEKDDDD